MPVLPAATDATVPAGPKETTTAAFLSPEAALGRAAHPLRTTGPRGGLAGLRPFGRMVGDARVVGLGEATHSSHEFFTVKQRVLRYLVEEKGFRAFAPEAPWSTGLRLDAYLLRGEGDLKRITDEEFRGAYRWWNNAGYRDLLRWIRAYNVENPEDPVRFVGDDSGFAGAGLYDAVNAYAAAVRTELAAETAELHPGRRPSTDAGTYVDAYLSKPLDERKALAGRTGRTRHHRTRPGPGAVPRLHGGPAQRPGGGPHLARLAACWSRPGSHGAATARGGRPTRPPALSPGATGRPRRTADATVRGTGRRAPDERSGRFLWAACRPLTGPLVPPPARAPR
ncbi:erythromycin esterase family protein [Streptomyces cinereoruber]|uniref:erythromycin esterase family protein n=1 Tax=Streptomyces cinereoruber TaxID=67260 RepID=UPI0036D0C257